MPRRPPQLTRRIFLGRTAVDGGLLTRAELRGPAWQPVFHGIYADATLALTHRHRCAAAAAWLLPPGAAIAGRSAAHLLGAASPPAGGLVEAVVPPGTRVKAAGLVVHHNPLDRSEVRRLGGLSVTTPLRTCWDLAQWLDPIEAVVLLDRIVAARLATACDLEENARQRAGQRGWRRALRAASLVDPGAESPPESRVRARLLLAGLPRPVTQYVIAHEGRFVARTDLAWPAAKVAVEYDGLWHADHIHADRRRLNLIQQAGWLVLHITARRMREDFDGFAGEVRAALRTRTPR